MTGPVKTVDEVLDFLGRIDVAELRYQQRKAAAIRTWALNRLRLGYTEGDRVEINVVVVDQERTPGWWRYREALAPGATATVEKIDFQPTDDGEDGRWVAHIRLDREWSVHDALLAAGCGAGPKRYWRGRAAETPEGMEPPSKFDQEHNPDGKTGLFVLHALQLRKHVEPPAPEVCDACGHMPDKAEE